MAAAPPVTAAAAPRPRSAAPPAAVPLWQRVRDSGWAFLLPFLLVYGAFLLWPLLYGLWLSLTDTSLVGGGGDLVGLANYAEALTDPMVWHTLGNTVYFTLISTVPLVLLALVMALLVHSGLPGQWLWRLSFFAPFLLPVATVALVWQWLFQGDFGFVNQMLAGLGSEGVGWLSDPAVAMWSIAITTVWWTVGFNFLLYLAALQSVPDHLYEAAAIDGAGAWSRLWSITLPQLRGTTGIVVVLQLLASMKVFDQIYIMTNGGPDDATTPVLLHVYDVGFTGYRIGYGAAISFLFLAIVVAVSLAQLWFTARRRAQR
ncbi:carbohydrate ABC transporter permease [Allonocardiopsis opalescens]|uniref:Carbohydrate ABC transporter membrane protein 1 (CUT1 family) n=1 Tax=Allonocardiopsis opalescens TaxID=1144618 RepID=A0A2T0PZ94_9ACTN|nr:sugar ABC transporter permease [Allonocardiopsis opalescens]PRX96848.1 carbohydrate ABC transporter membrane protein 1 (CUT1 family) [Allonocardiopsis opalescens]